MLCSLWWLGCSILMGSEILGKRENNTDNFQIFFKDVTLVIFHSILLILAYNLVQNNAKYLPQ